MLHIGPLMCKMLLNLVCAVVATTNKNSNASLVYSFLYKVVEVGHAHIHRCNLLGFIYLLPSLLSCDDASQW